MAEFTFEFTFTDEQGQLRAAVRKFCAENFDEQTVRRLMESDPPFDAKVWARLGAELGVLGLSVPEADGGVGGSLVDQAVAVEELGAALACGPVFGTVFLAIPALVAASSGPVRDELLAELVEGRRTAAFAVADRAGAFDPGGVGHRVADRRRRCTLTGTVERVVDARRRRRPARRRATGRTGWRSTPSTPRARACSAPPLVTLDLTRPQATSRLTDAPARLVAGPGEAERVIEHALQVGSALLAVEQVGAAQHLLDLSVEYAKSRLQFGRPIGSFQAVKHRLADLLVDLEHARSAAYHAVWALTDGSDDPGTGGQHRAGHGVGGVQPRRDRHHPGARRHRVHLGTPGALVLQARDHRRRAAGHPRAAPLPGRRAGAGHRVGGPGAAGRRRHSRLIHADWVSWRLSVP